uniref:Uncharacterized protein n=1 Tax=Avena sativa TaxID=4498 RepID=A0ACD6AA20_AVESA
MALATAPRSGETDESASGSGSGSAAPHREALPRIYIYPPPRRPEICNKLASQGDLIGGAAATARKTEESTARRKTAMRLIENARERAARYAKRTKGLQKMASELATLCAAPVALVCAPAPGSAGARLVWESQEGVLDRYRAAAVPPDTRARHTHTHRSYLEAELGKEKAKLAKARRGDCPGALPDWDAALNDMTLDEARELLETIDATLRAAGDRMVSLGLPADGRVELEQVAAPGDDAFDNPAAVAPQQLGLEGMDMGAGFQLQMMPCHGGDLLEQCLVQPGYGLECVVGGSYYGVGAVEETRAPGDYANNADCGWPDLTICYYPEFVDGSLAPHHYSSQVVTGGEYINTLPLEYTMGMDDNFTNLDTGYAAQWQAEEFQPSDTNSSMDENYTYLDNSTAQWQADESQPSGTNSTMDENYTYLDNSYSAQWQAQEFQHSDTNSIMDENYTYLDSSYSAHWQDEEFQHSDAGTSHYYQYYQFDDKRLRSLSSVVCFVTEEARSRKRKKVFCCYGDGRHGDLIRNPVARIFLLLRTVPTIIHLHSLLHHHVHDFVRNF